MSRIDVQGVGYLDATDQLNDANQLALLHFRDLVETLQATGAMAGSDSTAAAFAASYDAAAQACIGTFADLVGAYAGLGVAVSVSLENHSRAEHAANPLGIVTDSAPTFARGSWYAADPVTLPSSLGGDPSSLPGWAGWILDHVGGFVWPDADTDRLQAAASTWRAAAGDLDGLTLSTGAARGLLDQERSPEVPLAQSALLSLEQSTHRLATHLGELATTCDSYADQVAAQRQAILDLVSDLLRDTIILEAAGGILDFFTFGGATEGATALALARIAEKAPEIYRIIELIRGIAETAATTLRAIATDIHTLTTKLRWMCDLRMSARAAVDSSRLGSFRIGDEFAPGWLRRLEVRGSHIISRHVGKTPAELLKRLESDRRIRASSSFTDTGTAETSTGNVIAAHSDEIRAWLGGTVPELVLHARMPFETGTTVTRSREVLEVKGVRVLLRRTASGTFRVHTSFPQP